MGCILTRNNLVKNYGLKQKKTSESFQPTAIPHIFLKVRKDHLLVLRSIDEVSAYLEDSLP